MTWFNFTLIAIVIFVLLLFLHFCSEGTVYPYEHYLCSKVCHYPVDHVDFRSPPASTKFTPKVPNVMRDLRTGKLVMKAYITSLAKHYFFGGPIRLRVVPIFPQG